MTDSRPGAENETDSNIVLIHSPATSVSPQLVVRSAVPVGRPYNEYKRYLRRDFFYSCAYCTIAETEAQAIRFTIDHYEPRNAQPQLEN